MKRHPLVERAYQTRRNGDKRNALELYLEAAAALAETGDRLAEASAIRHAADLHEELGDNDAAWREYDQAWRLYHTLDPAPVLDLANCRRPMALWQERHGRAAEALTQWREARAGYEKAAVSTGLDMQPAFDECDRHITRLEGPV